MSTLLQGTPGHYRTCDTYLLCGHGSLLSLKIDRGFSRGNCRNQGGRREKSSKAFSLFWASYLEDPEALRPSKGLGFSNRFRRFGKITQDFEVLVLSIDNRSEGPWKLNQGILGEAISVDFIFIWSIDLILGPRPSGLY